MVTGALVEIDPLESAATAVKLYLAAKTAGTNDVYAVQFTSKGAKFPLRSIVATDGTLMETEEPANINTFPDAANNAVHRLWVELHYRSCRGPNGIEIPNLTNRRRQRRELVPRSLPPQCRLKSAISQIAPPRISTPPMSEPQVCRTNGWFRALSVAPRIGGRNRSETACW